MIRVHVHPGARRDALQGWRDDGALKLEVTARPEAGRANQVVTGLIAAALGIARTRVAVVRGGASRAKVIEVAGMAEQELQSRIEAVLAPRGRADDD